MKDVILKKINKHKLILDNEYVKLQKPNIYNSLDKTDEIKQIYDIEVDEEYRVLKLENKHKNELNGFIYLKNLQQWYNNKEKLFVRYMNVNNKFNYGGFLYKFNNYSITLINSDKKPWIISIKDNFIWYRRANSTNDNIRKEFEEFLKLNK